MKQKKDLLNLMSDKKEIESIIKLIRLKDFNSAENKILNLIKIYPESFDLLNLLGLCFVSKNYIIKGIACYKSAIRIKPNFAQAYNNLGLAFKSIGKIEDATKCYENAIKFKPNFAEAHNNLGLIMMDEGKIKNAEFNFKKALEIKPGLGYVHRHLSIVTKYSKKNSHIAKMKKVIADSNTLEDEKMHLAFALGKAHEDIKDNKNAFRYFKMGNELRRKTIDYNIKNDIIFFNKIKKNFSKDFFKKFKTNQAIHRKTPIFIIGMFRSGTTLVEQILSSHSQVFGGGESKALEQSISKNLDSKHKVNFPEIVHKQNKEMFEAIGKLYISAAEKFQPNYIYITDKQINNFKWVGIIKLALPNAKIIHCLRNPLDNCFSIYKNYFNFEDNPYAYDLNELGQYYNLYKDLMKYWHSVLPNFIYDISYEKLIRNQKEETKKLLLACNLQWDEKCMNFYQNKRNVSTASVMQVRKPIYKKSINSWKKYKKYIPELINSLKI